jgi:hypothetical protein
MTCDSNINSCKKQSSSGTNLIAKTTIYNICCFKNVGVPLVYISLFSYSQIMYNFVPNNFKECDLDLKIA